MKNAIVCTLILLGGSLAAHAQTTTCTPNYTGGYQCQTVTPPPPPPVNPWKPIQPQPQAQPWSQPVQPSWNVPQVPQTKTCTTVPDYKGGTVTQCY
ncbi:MAG TPA: hypothetical protein VIY29_00635 [Ktedonobacteraceae bacterium]